MPDRSTNTACLLIVLMLMALIGMGCASYVDAAEQPPAKQVYILSGQSNMVGSGAVNELDEAWRSPIEGASIYRNKQFVTVSAAGAKRFGPEIGFAHHLQKNQPDKQEIYLIKFALGGQPLDAGWGKTNRDGGGWLGPEPGPDRNTFYPGTSPDDPNIGKHYKRLHAHVTQAFNTLTAGGGAYELRGIVWMQGEADAKHEVSADRYDQTLALLKQRLEQDFADGANVPFVFGQVLPHEPALPRFGSRDLIRQRMAEVDWRSNSDRAVKNIWMVSTDGMEMNKDTVHYSTKGNLDLGQAFGKTMLEAHETAQQQHKK